MGERADRDVVHAGLGHRAEGLEGDAARGFQRRPPATSATASRTPRRHVVEQDQVDGGGECLVNSARVVDSTSTRRSAASRAARPRARSTAGQANVVVLDQDLRRPARSGGCSPPPPRDRVLLEGAQAGRRLARVEDRAPVLRRPRRRSGASGSRSPRAARAKLNAPPLGGEDRARSGPRGARRVRPCSRRPPSSTRVSTPLRRSTARDELPPPGAPRPLPPRGDFSACRGARHRAGASGRDVARAQVLCERAGDGALENLTSSPPRLEHGRRALSDYDVTLESAFLEWTFGVKVELRQERALRYEACHEIGFREGARPGCIAHEAGVVPQARGAARALPGPVVLRRRGGPCAPAACSRARPAERRPAPEHEAFEERVHVDRPRLATRGARRPATVPVHRGSEARSGRRGR